MTLKIWQFLSIILSALVAGMFYGPWAALSRSFRTLKPEVFLPVVDRMNKNMAPIMTVLMPASFLSMVPVLLMSYSDHLATFYLTLSAFSLLIVALLITMLVEVPIVEQIVTWTPTTLPDNWQHLRNRWGRFHIIRVVAGVSGLVLLLVAAIF
jgi:Domain of unknown function (DUF1772)